MLRERAPGIENSCGPNEQPRPQGLLVGKRVEPGDEVAGMSTGVTAGVIEACAVNDAPV